MEVDRECLTTRIFYVLFGYNAGGEMAVVPCGARNYGFLVAEAIKNRAGVRAGRVVLVFTVDYHLYGEGQRNSKLFQVIRVLLRYQIQIIFLPVGSFYNCLYSCPV